MRPAERNINPLDLNNLPEDFGKQPAFHEDSSSSAGGGGGGGYRKKKSGGKDGKDECGKVYECRFCSLKFCKSQALGGHMNRHRQERETETLNRARQLVYNNDNLAGQGTPHLSCQPITPGCYHPAGTIGDPTLSYRPVYSPRLFSAGSTSSSSILPPIQPPTVAPPPPSQPFLYPSPNSRLVSYPPPPPPPPQQQPINDYYVGHVLGSSSQYSNHYGAPETNYTCVGAPVGHGTVQSQEEGLNWGRSYGGGSAAQAQVHQPSVINRFQDGF